MREAIAMWLILFGLVATFAPSFIAIVTAWKELPPKRVWAFAVLLVLMSFTGAVMVGAGWEMRGPQPQEASK